MTSSTNSVDLAVADDFMTCGLGGLRELASLQIAVIDLRSWVFDLSVLCLVVLVSTQGTGTGFLRGRGGAVARGLGGCE